MPETAVLVGVGPGFCESFARKLAREGYAVAMFARSGDYLQSFADDLREAGHEALAVAADVTDPEQVESGFERIREELGPVEVLAHTASTTTDASGELDPDRFEAMWRLYAHAGLLCFRESLADLRETDGTVLFFGARGDGGDYAFKSAKAGTRGLARALATDYTDVHIAHVIIGGILLNPDVHERFDVTDESEYIDPEGAAETCYHLVEQDERCRTFELDVQAHGSPYAPR